MVCGLSEEPEGSLVAGAELWWKRALGQPYRASWITVRSLGSVVSKLGSHWTFFFSLNQKQKQGLAL
jgi:hypothetical protein